MANDGRRYTNDETRAIFEKALRADAESGLGHEDLLAAAAEMGLSRERVEQAIAEVELSQSETEARRAIIAQRRAGLRGHLVPYLSVNAFLFAINMMTGPNEWWFLYPLLGWGLGLFFHIWAALSTHVTEAQIQRQLRRAERRQRRSARKLREEDESLRQAERRARIKGSAHVLGEVLEEGAAALLTRLAADLRENTRSPLAGSPTASPPRGRRVPDLDDSQDGTDSAASRTDRRRQR